MSLTDKDLTDAGWTKHETCALWTHPLLGGHVPWHDAVELELFGRARVAEALLQAAAFADSKFGKCDDAKDACVVFAMEMRERAAAIRSMKP